MFCPPATLVRAGYSLRRRRSALVALMLVSSGRASALERTIARPHNGRVAPTRFEAVLTTAKAGVGGDHIQDQLRAFLREAKNRAAAKSLELIATSDKTYTLSFGDCAGIDTAATLSQVGDFVATASGYSIGAVRTEVAPESVSDARVAAAADLVKSIIATHKKNGVQPGRIAIEITAAPLESRFVGVPTGGRIDVPVTARLAVDLDAPREGHHIAWSDQTQLIDALPSALVLLLSSTEAKEPLKAALLAALGRVHTSAPFAAKTLLAAQSVNSQVRQLRLDLSGLGTELGRKVLRQTGHFLASLVGATSVDAIQAEFDGDAFYSQFAAAQRAGENRIKAILERVVADVFGKSSSLGDLVRADATQLEAAPRLGQWPADGNFALPLDVRVEHDFFLGAK